MYFVTVNMNRAILVAIVYIIVAGIELLAYYLSKSDCVYFYGFITLIAFIFTSALFHSEN